MWETKSEGGCPSVYEVLGVPGCQAIAGWVVPISCRPRPSVPASASQNAVPCRTDRLRSNLHLPHDGLHTLGDGSDLGGDLGSAAPLPDLFAKAADAHSHRLLDAYSLWPAANRVYLPVRPWHSEGRRSADHRPSGARLAAA